MIVVEQRTQDMRQTLKFVNGLKLKVKETQLFINFAAIKHVLLQPRMYIYFNGIVCGWNKNIYDKDRYSLGVDGDVS